MRSPKSAAAVLAFAFLTLLAAAPNALALEWEIERNFRYFDYPSDLAAQRVARDIYIGENGHAPTVEQLELFTNGQGFWTTPLARAGAVRQRWPLAWRVEDDDTVLTLIKRLRQAENRPKLKIGPRELGRLGWASLLAEGLDAKRPTGYTATCWNPGERLHSNCPQWGDYVRPPAWIVRVFDPQAPAGQQCAWTLDGAVSPDAAPPLQFVAQARVALAGGGTGLAGDCREIRALVPSDPKDPKAVAGRATVTRISPDHTQTSVVVTPRDRLVIGFGDSFTSGEGNPETPATFTGLPWQGGNLPARAADPVTLRDPDTRAQWTDRWCHRSVYSWQIRSALYAALADMRQSVTLLPYGCSGATIPAGLLFAYNGVEWDRSTDHGVKGSRAEIGLAYQELCQNFEPADWRKTDPPSPAEEAKPGYYDRAIGTVRKYVARCTAKPGGTNVFKRQADAVLLDIGINDVGFASWVEGVLLEEPLRSAAGGFIPCVTNSPTCVGNYAQTKPKFDQLTRRYALLRETLDRYLLPEFGVDPAHVIVAVYPPALENERGEFCRQNNSGLTVATFPSFPPSNSCSGALNALGAFGAITAYRYGEEALRDVEAARVKLNEDLAGFALDSDRKYTVVSAYSPDFNDRGACATQDAASRPSNPDTCFSAQDTMNVGCAVGDPESMHVPRATDGGSCLPNNGDIASFHPFPPGRFEPYRHRARLFRTQNDVFVLINQRPNGAIDAGAYGPIDLYGRTTGGLFHPSAEAHAIIANETAPQLCEAIGCAP